MATAAAFVAAISIMTPTVGRQYPMRTNTPSTNNVSCDEAFRIFAAISARENSPDDRLLRTAPDFPQVVIQTQTGRTTRVRAEERSELWRKGWLGSAPAKDLVMGWFAAPYRSLGSCLPHR